ncbi:MAG: hypothetical protein V4677_07875 [Bacteroidota bacterium]
MTIIITLCFINSSCAKKHACDCRYADGTSYNIVESSKGDCSEWNEPQKGVTCKVVD